MSAEDPEAQLRARVTRAVANVGEPDRRRLAAIEQGLPVERRSGTAPALWLGAALVVASAAGAGAMWWPGDEATHRPPEAAEPAEAGPSQSTASEANPEAPDEQRDQGPGDAEVEDESGDDPVIYRR